MHAEGYKTNLVDLSAPKSKIIHRQSSFARQTSPLDIDDG
jgi:hypothetical protein